MQLIDGRPVYAATDLVGFLACGHRFELERAALAGRVEKPIRSDPTIELVQERGYAHERRYLAELEASGRRVVRIERDGSAVDPANPRDRDPGRELREAAAETLRAMETAADVIYQATFFDGTWRGHADFLLRVDHGPEDPPSAFGEWHYEVADTKLARHVKGSAILQVCSYVDQLVRIQRTVPEWLHLALGGSAREVVSLRVADYMAYFRQVKADFLAAADAARVGPPAYPPATTYPEPVEHCEICRWWADCRDRRRRDDDLSLVAGISARQRRGLKTGDPGSRPGRIATRRGLAALELDGLPRLDWSSRPALERVREQARIQVEGEDAGEVLWELLEPEWEADEAGARHLVADRGFLALPDPSPNDLFLDLEGDPFAFDDGVDYLFGLLDPAGGTEIGPNGVPAPVFRAIWSLDDEGRVTLAAEKAAFERLVDLLIARLDADPTLHVYHYAAYEKTALARLAQRHATREAEVDRLLRGRVLVDLYRVVRQGIRASVESYSIKRLEPLYGLKRAVELKDAGSSIVAFETWLGRQELPGVDPAADPTADDALLREIEGYNRDDVLSNWRLRDWLEDRRLDLGRKLGMDVPRPAPEAAAAGEPLKPREEEVASLVTALTAGIDELAPEARSEEERARWLLAQLIGWHRRENKAFWWRYFELLGMTDEDLVETREAIGMVQLETDLGEASGNGARHQRFRFPPQDHAVKPGRQVDDPRTKRSTGTVQDVDDIAGTVTLRRTATQIARGLPRSLVPNDYVPTDVLEGSLIRTGRWILEHGIDAGTGELRAARQLLLQRPPRVAGLGPGEPLRNPDEPALDAARRLVVRLDGATLAIQGPPGTGKTYAGAEMVLDLVAKGRRVGVTANSHKVIGHLLDEVHEAAARPDRRGLVVRVGQRPGQNEAATCLAAVDLAKREPGQIAADLATGVLQVLGGTAWLWSNEAMAGSVDVLLIDEAGQFSLANTIAIAPAADSLVLLGDPQQLDQPLKGSHPPGAERSALAHLLASGHGEAEHATMPPGRGLFMDRTRRLHPAICAYTSEVFYASELLPLDGLDRQAIEAPAPFGGAGIRWLPVAHAGNDTDSPEEAAAICGLLLELLDPEAGTTWTNENGEVLAIRQDDVVIVAPYNAHVDRIAATLEAAGLGGVRVGTVDRFQGQEAPISIYAMGSSSPEDAPRGMAFLYSLNRLNVATSRARCVAAVVASPALVRVECRTPRQMRLANALCRLVEVATAPGRGGASG